MISNGQLTNENFRLAWNTLRSVNSFDEMLINEQ